MNRIQTRVATTLVLWGVAMAAQAGEAEVRKSVQALMPQGRIESIAPSGSDGYFEAVVDGQVIYVSDDGKHLFTGELWQIEGRRNLTAQRKDGIRHDALAAVGPDQRIVFAAAKPKHTITVFTDFDCGYCQKMHAQIDEYNARGISVEYMLFPRGGLNSPSLDKAVSVWCAVERKQAFTLAKAGTAPTPKTCPNQIAENYALGARLGVTGTPTVIDAKGSIANYLPPDQMLARLEASP